MQTDLLPARRPSSERLGLSNLCPKPADLTTDDLEPTAGRVRTSEGREKAMEHGLAIEQCHLLV
jgi:hypothetical protein